VLSPGKLLARLRAGHRCHVACIRAHHLCAWCAKRRSGLQVYSDAKKAEHALKSMRYDGDAISVVDPRLYAKRFTDFMRREVFCGGHPKADSSAVGATVSG
jgi:Phosphatidylinositol-4-phosphate 5-Kinase